MQISPVSFKSGLLLYKGNYIVPEQIKKFGPNCNNKEETRIFYNNTKNDVLDVKPEYFATAWINAKNTNDIILLDKE